MKITVFGASGDQGQAQMRQLLAAGHQPLAAARDPASLDPDWPAIVADYGDADSLRRAVAGAEAVFLTLPSTSFQKAQDVQAAAARVAEATRDAGVGMLVFNSSMIICDAHNGFAAHDARFAIREQLFASGVPTVSIQPVIYLDNLLRAWAYPDIIGDSMIRYPHEETLEVCWISEDDTAKLMIAAAERPGLAGRAFNVGGREAVRGPVLAQRLSEVLGRRIGFETLPIARFAERMATVFQSTATLDVAALTTALERIYAWYNHAPERPFQVDMGPVLAELPVALESIEQWAARQNWG
ncbi:SDR family oxidoreductase [Polymorphobacter sp.]|uniref:SDR family oxidoreductase n=1 Tax=Polymorphobacter sp. TaxID=1909290 RepID=UPI003F6F12A3